VIPTEVDETIPEDKDFTPEEVTIYLAELKAEAAYATLDKKDWPTGCNIIGVDTIVYKDHIIGKPVDEADALKILRSLKNSTHEVISGVCVIHVVPMQVTLAENHKHDTLLARARRHKFAETTTVRLGDYTDEEILDYIRANPPYDKSGSYAIQSDWSRHVLEVDGDIENVIGLPYKRLSEYLFGLAGIAGFKRAPDN
jgi:septum formation protein